VAGMWRRCGARESSRAEASGDRSGAALSGLVQTERRHEGRCAPARAPSTARCHVDAPNKTPTHMPEEGDVDPGSHLSRGASPELTPVGEAELSKMRRLLKWQIMACAPTAADRAFACEAAGWHAVHTPRTHTGAHDRVHIARIAAAGRRELHGVRLGTATED
jgi:hypothetical protein